MQILRNAIAIERADRVLEISRLRDELAEQSLMESDARADEARIVLKRAGLL